VTTPTRGKTLLEKIKIYMKKKIIVIILISFFKFGFSQESKYSINLNLAGNSGFYSISGEKILKKYDNSFINSNLGFGFLKLGNYNFYSIPFSVNYLQGSKKHHIEYGLGLSYLYGIHYVVILPPENTNYCATNAIYLTPSISYKFDKLKKGFIFKVSYSPLFVLHDFFNKDKFLKEATKNFQNLEDYTLEEIYDIIYISKNYPIAENKLGYFGISLGYRF
jgi:hypothetical protein